MQVDDRVQVKWNDEWVKGIITDMASERGQTVARVEFDVCQTLRSRNELLAAPIWWFDVLDLCLIL